MPFSLISIGTVSLSDATAARTPCNGRVQVRTGAEAGLVWAMEPVYGAALK
jgi:hypothetical protein